MEILINGQFVESIYKESYSTSPDQRDADNFTYQDLERLYKMLLKGRINYKVRIEITTDRAGLDPELTAPIRQAAAIRLAPTGEVLGIEEIKEPEILYYVFYLGEYVKEFDTKNPVATFVTNTYKSKALKFKKETADDFIKLFPNHTFIKIPV